MYKVINQEEKQEFIGTCQQVLDYFISIGFYYICDVLNAKYQILRL